MNPTKKKTNTKEGSSRIESDRLNTQNLLGIFEDFWNGYTNKTPKKIKILDAFCVLCFFLTALQIGYCGIVGSFPMNSFLSGVFAPLGALTITTCLRFQINEETKYMRITNERAIWEYLFCMLILFLVTVNFLG